MCEQEKKQNTCIHIDRVRVRLTCASSMPCWSSTDIFPLTLSFFSSLASSVRQMRCIRRGKSSPQSVYLQMRSTIFHQNIKVEDMLISTPLPSTVNALEVFLTIWATNHNNKETTNNNWHGEWEMSRLGESSSMTFSFFTSSSAALSAPSQHPPMPV